VTDVHTAEQRSRNMAAIRNKDTTPELRVRRALHAMGFRYRLHSRDLPGKPDLVLARYNTVVFVHGCFWHMHRCHYGRPKPATNASFWEQKRYGNVERDRRNRQALQAAGWRDFVVWECETRDPEKLLQRLGKLRESLHDFGS
jgi:DNA mismatch endonuclease, patch repair protein